MDVHILYKHRDWLVKLSCSVTETRIAKAVNFTWGETPCPGHFLYKGVVVSRIVVVSYEFQIQRVDPAYRKSQKYGTENLVNFKVTPAQNECGNSSKVKRNNKTTTIVVARNKT